MIHETTTLKKKLLYEVLGLLGTQREDIQCSTFKISFVASVKDSISVDLRRDILKNSTKETLTISPNDILASVTQIYNESISSAAANPTVDNKLDAANIDGIDDDYKITNQRAGTHISPPRDTTAKKTMHVLLRKNPWNKGHTKSIKNNVLVMHAEGVCGRRKEASIRS